MASRRGVAAPGLLGLTGGASEMTPMPLPCVLLSLTCTFGVSALQPPRETLVRTRRESAAVSKSSTLLLLIFQSTFNSFGEKPIFVVSAF